MRWRQTYRWTGPAARAGRGFGIVSTLMWCTVGHAQTGSASSPPDTAWTRKPPQVFGYVQVVYRYTLATGSDPVVANDNFRVQRVRIGLRGDVTPRVSYDVEFDPRAPLISTVLRDAFIRIAAIPRHEIRVGQQKTQFGWEGRESSSDLFAVNRTEVSENLGRGVNLRDIGVGVMGNLKLGGGLRIEHAITVVNGAGMNAQKDNTPRKNVLGRVGIRWKDDPRDFVARLGISGGTGDILDEGDDPDDPSDDVLVQFDHLGMDVEFDHPWAFFSAEYARGTDENRTTGETDEPQAYYVNLVGKTPQRVGPIVRYDTLDDEFVRWTFGAYYGMPSEALRVMVNYELRQKNGGERGDDKLYVWTQVRF